MDSGLSTHVARKKKPATPLGERLQWILDSRELSARQFALDAGASPTYVAQIIRGDIGDRISYEKFAALAKAADVDLHWLQTGEGSPQATTTEPIHDEPGDPIDLAIAFYLRGKPPSPGLKPRIMAKLSAVMGHSGPTDDLLLAVVKAEIDAEKSEATGRPSKVAEGPDHVPDVRPGGTFLEE